jgi:hypothetical protein
MAGATEWQTRPEEFDVDLQPTSSLPQKGLHMSQADNTTDSSTEPASQVPKVTWEDSKMVTAYANVVNVASTREEVSVFFGTNQTWNLGKDREVKIQLSHRIVLNPYAAKRLQVLTNRIVQEYEKRFGPLSLDSSEDAARP